MSNYTKFQEMTRKQKIRVLLSSVALLAFGLFAIGLAFRIGLALFMAGFKFFGLWQF